ncbi:MAG: 16S rRNA (cytosine(1402)-N(4))-methyltransferase RsmH [Vicinamibacterales bacterium]
MVVHEPVLRDEVVSALVAARGGTFVDCTVGLGGHARALLEAGATRLIGIDRDRESLSIARDALRGWGDRVDLVHADFREIDRVLDWLGIDLVSGIVSDLGMSSYQLEAEGRGFSFQREAPLDMRMDRSTGRTLGDLLDAVSEEQLANVIFRYGEERHSRRIARAIVEARRGGRLSTTSHLAETVRRAIPRRAQAARLDPATRTFQALRIWTNDELSGLDDYLAASCRRLEEGGRLAVIAFHSLEDRVVKHTFRRLSADPAARMVVVTRRPVTASEDELERNPRSRSAKLRVIERVAA